MFPLTVCEGTVHCFHRLSVVEPGISVMRVTWFAMTGRTGEREHHIMHGSAYYVFGVCVLPKLFA